MKDDAPRQKLVTTIGVNCDQLHSFGDLFDYTTFIDKLVDDGFQVCLFVNTDDAFATYAAINRNSRSVDMPVFAAKGLSCAAIADAFEVEVGLWLGARPDLTPRADIKQA